MKKRIYVFSVLWTLSHFAMAGSPVNCSPNTSTSFQNYLNRAYTVSNDNLGNMALASQCTNLTDKHNLGNLSACGAIMNPINGLGLNPMDQLLYGLMPTDSRGIGTHLEMPPTFPMPQKLGDFMKADPVDVFRIGNDGGYENIGFIQPPSETATSGDIHQVVPIVHSAATFNESGDYFLLAYRTNYESSGSLLAGTAKVEYQMPQIVIGQVSHASLATASGGNLPTVWLDVDVSSDQACTDVMTEFQNQTNIFSTCVVNNFRNNGNYNQAVDTCLTQTNIMDKGIHDFAVSPYGDNHFYAYDSQTYSDKDVLIDVDPNTMTAACSEFTDVGNLTGRLTSLMFSQQNKLVALFADESNGIWIDVTAGTSYGDFNLIATPVTPFPHGDGSSLPFNPLKSLRGALADLIFKNGFEDFIFANGFEGDEPPPPTCPVF
ncbi:hypothetical protein [Marinicella gelatinilytica]|uniref:hypothetical protein n=1 Tax=Marinicella gelatinilytica TaxID=2996017 RepID=UPI002260F198|nr:hypothetical protein [Marinicella gelatinilytica]MCX7545008.1 hypothetical protein [Marinicella gelatinilytica]